MFVHTAGPAAEIIQFIPVGTSVFTEGFWEAQNYFKIFNITTSHFLQYEQTFSLYWEVDMI
jgi:hypothetical protein